jgi:hypothetical protein
MLAHARGSEQCHGSGLQNPKISIGAHFAETSER